MCLFVGNTQGRRWQRGGRTPVPTSRQYRQTDTSDALDSTKSDELEVVWSGERHRQGLCCDLSGYYTGAERGPATLLDARRTLAHVFNRNTSTPKAAAAGRESEPS